MSIPPDLCDVAAFEHVRGLIDRLDMQEERQARNVSNTPELDDLRRAIMLASEPRPGRRIDAVLVVSVWVDEANPVDAVMDVLASPPEHAAELLRHVKAMPMPEGP